MVRRVKAWELCGTIAGLPWHQETRREGQRSGGGGERLEDSAGTGGGLGAAGQRGFLCHGGGGRVQGGITTSGGRSSWIDMRESSVRCYTTGKYVQ